MSLIVCEALKVKSKYTWILFFIGAVVSFLNKSRFMMLNFLIIFALIPIYIKLKISTVFKGFVIIVLILSATLVIAKMINFNIGEIVNERILEKDRKNLVQTSAGTRIIAFQVFAQLFLKTLLLEKECFIHSDKKEAKI
ncbi:MAG: hypothetical protein HC905_28185 [Bacteroidales bacterium]|nr:hypothetical protein [Bacteroidales bacterium]